MKLVKMFCHATIWIAFASVCASCAFLDDGGTEVVDGTFFTTQSKQPADTQKSPPCTHAHTQKQRGMITESHTVIASLSQRLALYATFIWIPWAIL